MSLVDFLADETTGSSWADEMDELPTAPPREQGQGFGLGGQGAFPSRSRYDDGGAPPFAREDPPLPTEPPFTAFVVNLSFESTESDVQYFFEPLKPLSVRLVSSHDGRPKGYGYVEFETLDNLKEALTYTGKPLDNRNVRVSVAEPSSRGSRGIADDASQWRRSTPLPPSDRGGFGGSSGPGFDDMGVGADGSRSGFGGKFNPSADRQQRRNTGPYEPSQSDTASDWRTGKPVSAKGSSRFGFGHGDHDRASGGFERRSSGATDEGFANWRAGRQASGDGASAPQARRKLDLKPRGSTLNEETKDTTASADSSRASPFGAAKPVDSGQRDREIENRLREQERLRREQRLKQDELKKTQSAKPKTEGSWRSAPSAESEKVDDATSADSEWKTV
ncbi:Eukaryotic translation initiation factor 4B [Malassezia yamatoensis]|uniref:Eukaryotic translation initiation factor 4B n=1 Tax=Malassezia yamatoensis TaxID=253288 RepID=A0AAJ5YVA5_9BASI|nr:Eukaryotic translation initiation factor 4B [Malassezia yamatoensis]